MSFEVILLQTLSFLAIFVTLGGALLILTQTFYEGSYRRARRILVIMLVFGGVGALNIALTTKTTLLLDFHVMSPSLLVGGAIYTLCASLFPLELSRPGWVSWRHIVKLSLPLVAITAIYICVLTQLNQSVAQLENLVQLLAQSGKFNVWYRYVLYLTTCLYLAYMLINSSSQKIRHNKKRNGDKSHTPPQVNSWLRVYNIGLVCLTIVYLAILLHNSIWIQIIYRTTVLLFWIVIIYEVAFKRHTPHETSPKA